MGLLGKIKDKLSGDDDKNEQQQQQQPPEYAYGEMGSGVGQEGDYGHAFGQGEAPGPGRYNPRTGLGYSQEVGRGRYSEGHAGPGYGQGPAGGGYGQEARPGYTQGGSRLDAEPQYGRTHQTTFEPGTESGSYRTGSDMRYGGVSVTGGGYMAGTGGYGTGADYGAGQQESSGAGQRYETGREKYTDQTGETYEGRAHGRSEGLTAEGRWLNHGEGEAGTGLRGRRHQSSTY